MGISMPEGMASMASPSLSVGGMDPSGGQSGAGAQTTPLGSDYKSIIDHCLAVMGKEQDEVDKAELAKVVSSLQRILARNQQDAEKALGDQGLGRLMRKAGGGY